MQRKEILTIRLCENPTSGHFWQCTADAAGIIEKTGEAFEPSKRTCRLGAGGIRLFRFAAVCDGVVNLTFSYRRAFSAVQEPSGILTCTVTVSDGGITLESSGCSGFDYDIK